mmetsp:Transcript_6321/g.9182  ORF Transcript_6321/g.9182 Transcript_6321/m.9182 type:complete len:181 (+) Transcript_6321:90-632(+)|eukprot:CAMPEP_0184859480 /NCGR_PEP_ID=MMETSP0580-20130426/4468_1 /TAXON_ID=1118495 /ORGANISM="Dactyliosolen fragilissimus" /LENGTH=180 /DNA_ID=CAMNT_0027356121 /DNA_START=46 /DNA_END=588 /DNA_ORIENTATION=-
MASSRSSQYDEAFRNNRPSQIYRSRSRSTSPSPQQDDSRSKASLKGFSERDRHEQQRKMRMAKLRAENEAEEKKMAALDNVARRREAGLDFEDPFNRQTRKSGRDEIIEMKEGELDDIDENEKMQQLFGFSGSFSSTKGKLVKDNHKSAAKGAASKNKARKYRQYMNRKGGFNRALDKMN